MKVYIISSKNDFNQTQIDSIKKIANLEFIEQPISLLSEKIISSNEPKILAINPDNIIGDFSNETIMKIPNLKALCLMTTGYGYVDTKFLAKNGVLTTNVPKYSTDSVAEYAIFLMQCVAKKLPLQIKNNMKEDFSEKYLGLNLTGKKAGIIGLGSIGNRIAQLCKGLGMDVFYWSKNSKDSQFKYSDLKEIFETCDFIFPAMLKNQETKSIITNDLIDLAKPTASIITIVGNMFDHNYVCEKVKRNELYGYAFENSNDSIFKYDGNIMVTSAYAWYTKESLNNCISIWVDSILSIIKEKPINLV